MASQNVFIELDKDPIELDPDILNKIPKKNKMDSDDYFLKRKRGTIRNPSYRKFMGGKNTVYEYIWAGLIRGNLYNDRYNIKRDYYNKGFLAYASTYNHIAEACYMDKNTVIRHIEDFERIGAIKIEKIGPKPNKIDKLGRIIDKRKTVFILGTWHKEIIDGKEKIEERYYIEDVFDKLW